MLALAIRAGAGSGFLRDNVDVVRTTIGRLVGRPVEIRLDVEGVAAPKPVAPRGLIPPEVREHPVVKLAADLFDASVVDVTPLRRDESADEGAGGSFGGPSIERSTEHIGDEQDV
ncbi:MAG: hypothetical protein U0572_12060 [Phycisphaerales bacterium]